MKIETWQTEVPAVDNVVVDWGNTHLKTAWFTGSTLVETARFTTPNELVTRLTQQPVKSILVSSTSRPAEEIRQQLTGVQRDILILDSETKVPVRKAYDTPATLGADRIAAAVGATTLFPNRACLVLDLGTCLTADLVDDEAVFQGGLISPGLRMRFRAMHEQTARLPLVQSPVDWPELTAKNTQAALQSGVLNGLTFELNGIIDAYRHERPDIVVLLCGGDAVAFESRLKPPIFVVPELVLIGLNRILRYNVEPIQANTPDVNA